MEKLKRIYLDPKNPASFGGVDRLYKAVKNRGLKRHQVCDFLTGQECYTTLKPVIRKFSRNHFLAYYKNEVWQSDLMDVRFVSRANSGIQYLLICIDVLSRKAHVTGLRDKSALSVTSGLKKLIGNHKIKFLHTDRGKEYYNQHVQKYLTQKNIKLYSTYNYTIKAGIAERFIRTLRGRIARYSVANKTSRYIDVLPQLVEAYNRASHRNIGMPPNAVTNKKVQRKVFLRLYGPADLSFDPKTRFKLGDTVKIAKLPELFARGSRQSQWEPEIYTVTRIIRQTYQQRPLYLLRNTDNEEVKGRFYAEELQRVKVSS